MNMSASFTMWFAMKTAFSQSNSFIFKFTTHVSEIVFELNKETSYEIDKVRK